MKKNGLVVRRSEDMMSIINSDDGLIGIDNERKFIVGKVKKSVVMNVFDSRKKSKVRELLRKAKAVKVDRSCTTKRGVKCGGISDMYFSFGWRYAYTKDGKVGMYKCS